MSDFFSGDVDRGLAQMRLRLLDLTNGNRLLNFRHFRKSSLRIVDELPDELCANLVEGRELFFKAMPAQRRNNGEALTDISFDLPRPNPSALDNVSRRQAVRSIHTPHQPAELEDILRTVGSSARLAIEETGTNMLYLVFGFLEWYESGESTSPFYAPLLLLPVSLARSVPDDNTRTYRYSIRYSGEDILSNVTLRERLKHDFNLQLPELDDGETPEEYFLKVKPVLEHDLRWRVRRQATLTLLSFGKLLLYKDLDPRSWPENAGPAEHPRVSEFFEGVQREGISHAPEYALDDSSMQARVPMVVDDADSSQHSALVDALEGRNLVIEGPPGTGKSQTITNLIAAALAQGKTVLFVSEKLAALEVVRHRLDRVGLGDFCLELHSNKAQKRKLLDDVEARIAKHGRYRKTDAFEEKQRQLARERQHLDEYVALISERVGHSGQPLFDLIWSAARQRRGLRFDPALVDAIRVPGVHELTPEDLELRRERTARFARHLGEVGDVGAHSWYGLTNASLTFLDEPRLVERLEALVAAAAALLDELETLAATTGGSCAPKSVRDVRAVCSALGTRQQRAALGERFDLSRLPPLSHLSRLVSVTANAPWWSVFNSEYRAAVKTYRGLSRGEIRGSRNDMVKSFRAMVDLVEAEARHADLLSRLRDLIAEPGPVIAALESKSGALEVAWASFDEMARVSASDWLGDSVEFESAPITSAVERARRAIDGRRMLPAWLDYVRARAAAADVGLEPVLRLAEERRLTPTDLAPACEFIAANSLVNKALADRPALARFSGLSHDMVRENFARLDQETIALYRARAAYLIDQRPVPAGVGVGPVSGFTELQLLEREIAKQRRHIPIRQLMRRSGQALQALKPCFMMGPLSVAQYLEPGALSFDLVIMDEASQLKPEDALGAIARAAQVVIVGDARQLPPTSFFDRIGDEDEEVEEVEENVSDAESILDVASMLYRPSRLLRWHYRSRHGSLIAFSNREFYDSRLFVFPSPVARSPVHGVKLVRIDDGVYEGRRNRREAERVVEAALIHMRDRPDESLGIVTLNATQRELVESLMDQRLKADAEARQYVDAGAGGLEPFFIKNLENVQGDERDVIFLSVTYGPSASGQVYQRFGPINGPNGHRRLNVLFTRARDRVVVFSSLHSTEVAAPAGSSWGVRALKAYLADAESGESAHSTLAGQVPRTDFEVEVAAALRERGFDVVARVGVAGFYVDLAVRHPLTPDVFILGIECDGGSFQAGLTARDRDRLRPAVLKGLGWEMHRIWSADWVKNCVNEVDRIVARIHALMGDVGPVLLADQPSGSDRSEIVRSAGTTHTQGASS